jgi:biotin carboxyl carrier protein
MILEIVINSRSVRLQLEKKGESWLCHLDGRVTEIDPVLIAPGVLSLLIEGHSYEVRQESATRLWIEGKPYDAEVRDPRSLKSRRGATADDGGPKKLTAPMPGKVVRYLVVEGAAVEAGQGLVVVEAMKMQNEIKSPKKGMVKKLVAAVGAAVNAGDALLIVE